MPTRQFPLGRASFRILMRKRPNRHKLGADRSGLARGGARAAADQLVPMRILTVSNLFPTVVEGGYEARCAATMGRLDEEHDVYVLTSTLRRDECPPDPRVLRDLPFLPQGKLATLAAPRAAARGMKVMQRTLDELQPD